MSKEKKYLILIGYKKDDVNNMDDSTIEHLYNYCKDNNIISYRPPDLLDRYKGKEREEIREIANS